MAIGDRWNIFEQADTIVTTKFDDLNGIVDAQIIAIDALLLNFSTAVDGAATELSQIISDIAIGDVPTLTISSFTGTAPTAITVTYNAPTLTDVDDIQDIIRAKLVSDITNQSPAISSSVETDIFNRETERAELLHQDALDDIANEWSKRGYTLPNAYLLAALSLEIVNYTNKRLDISRDIAIKNFELTDANMKFAIQQGLAYIINRIEVYKSEIQAEISRIDAEVKVYLAQVEVYRGEAQVYAITVDAAVKEFEAKYKAAMMEAEINLKIVDAEIKKVEVVYGMSVESTRATSVVRAQVLAGALSGVHATAQISASNSADYQYSTNPSY